MDFTFHAAIAHLDGAIAALREFEIVGGHDQRPAA